MTFICVLLIGVLLVLCEVSVLHLQWVIKVIKLSMLLSFHSTGSHQSRFDTILSGIPNSPLTAVEMLGLLPHCTEYVCCPSCFAIYDTSPGKGPYPKQCTNQDTPDSPVCNRLLRKSGGTNTKRVKPVRKYLYQNMKEWMAALLTREGFEEKVDRDLSPNHGGEMHDIWDAPELHNFKGPDGSLFIKPGLVEGRYIFSLCMDGFNPYQSKEAGKKVSVGAIYMVCLNLPPELRYRLENIFLVAIIPGPTEPSTHQINHLLKPLIDDLLDFWEPGVMMASTPKFPSGRLVRCAVIPLVCDLPAAKQMAGHGSHCSKRFCSFCRAEKSQINKIDMLWPILTWEEHRTFVNKWKDAADKKSRAAAFENNGI